MDTRKLAKDLSSELEETRRQLQEANDMIDAIRTGQVDALVVQAAGAHQVYTLRSADHAYRIFVEKMSEGAVTLTRDGMIIYANSRFSSMIEKSLSEVIATPFSEWVCDAHKSSFNDLFCTAWEQDCKGEVELCHNSESSPVQLSLSAMIMDDGTFLSIVVTDLTFQKSTQTQLEDNNKLLDQINKNLEASNHDLQQFASVASHDLQEPLRKIQMFANSMAKTTNGKLDEKEQRFLTKMISSADRMKTLIIDVLTYSKLSANNSNTLPTDLNDVVKDLLEDFELLIQEKNAEIICEKLPVLDANPGQMRQVFQNLISNSLKFSKADIPPKIVIWSKYLKEKNFNSAEQSPGQYCLIGIEDNGIGFDEQYIPNIFSLFERLNPKDEYEGSGIGLAVIKKIVEKHSGIIRVKSRVGVGSVFEIIFPLKKNA